MTTDQPPHSPPGTAADAASFAPATAPATAADPCPPRACRRSSGEYRLVDEHGDPVTVGDGRGFVRVAVYQDYVVYYAVGRIIGITPGVLTLVPNPTWARWIARYNDPDANLHRSVGFTLDDTGNILVKMAAVSRTAPSADEIHEAMQALK